MVRLRSASWALGSQVLSLLVSVPMSILLARALGPTGKGELTLAQLVASLGVTIGAVGLPSAVVYLAAKREANARVVLRTVLLVAALATGLPLIAAFVLGSRFDQALNVESSVALRLGLLAIFPSMVKVFMDASLTGIGRIRETSLLNSGVLLAQLAVMAVLWATGHLTPTIAVAVWLVLVSVGSIVTTRIALRHDTQEVPNDRVAGFLASGIRYGLLSWVAGGLGILVLRLDVLLLSSLRGLKEVGIYSVSVALAELLFYVPNSITLVLVPKIASTEGTDTVELPTRITRVMWPFILLVAVVLASVATFLIPVLYGQAFRPAILALWLLVPGVTFSALSAGVSGYIWGSGKIQVAVVANTANLVANVALNLVLIPPLGVAGAALASSVSYALGAFLLLLAFSRSESVPWRDLLVPRVSDFSAVWAAVSDAVRSRVATGPADEIV